MRLGWDTFMFFVDVGGFIADHWRIEAYAAFWALVLVAVYKRVWP